MAGDKGPAKTVPQRTPEGVLLLWFHLHEITPQMCMVNLWSACMICFEFLLALFLGPCMKMWVPYSNHFVHPSVSVHKFLWMQLWPRCQVTFPKLGVSTTHEG